MCIDNTNINLGADGADEIREKSEFEAELENYLPTPENTDKLKKAIPSWVFSAAASAAVCLIMLGTYSLTVLPKLRPRAVISYSENSQASESTLPDTESIAIINENVSKSIVSVESTTSYKNFFGISSSTNSGSGIILTEDGYILTACSLIGSDGKPTVILPDNKEYDATVVGEDANKDLALVKIDAAALPYVTLGNSDNVRAGDNAIVIGNTLDSGLGTSVTRGIICGVNRGVTLKNGGSINLLQTDAITSTGSAGGCLTNSSGEVVGMITAAVSSNSDSISFAIPSNDIKTTVESLINTGEAPKTLVIGITGSDTDHGVTVESVLEDTPAARAGLKVGDLILKVDSESIKSISDINQIRDRHKKGDKLVLSIYRDGEMLDVEVVL